MSRILICLLSLTGLIGCTPASSDNCILFTGPSWIAGMDLASGRITTNFSIQAVALIDVDYDPVEQRVYWVQSLDNKIKIKSAGLDGTGGTFNNNRIPIGFPYRFALDPDSRLLFYHDMRAIYRTQLKSSAHIKIVDDSAPVDFAIDIVRKQVYWLDTDTIWRVNYSGFHKAVFLDLGNKTNWVAMAVDAENGVLYFADDNTGLIEAINVDGTNRRTLANNYNTYTSFYAVLSTLDYSGGNLYFANRSTDQRHKSLTVLPVTGGAAMEIGPALNDIPNGIHAFSSIQGPEGTRLVNGSSPKYGRLEVRIKGQWIGVCADFVDRNTAKVICHSLGYDRYELPADAIRLVNLNGPDANLHQLHNSNCSGNEIRLSDCDVQDRYNDSCQSNRDVIIDCAPPLEDIVHLQCTSTTWLVTVDMDKLSYRFPGSRASDIYLGDNSCTGSPHGNNLVFVEDFDSCLSTQAQIKDGVKYLNQLIYATHDPAHPYEVTTFNWSIELVCTDLNNSAFGMLLAFNHSVSIPNIPDTSRAYHFQMEFYTDSNFMQPLSGDPLTVPEGTFVYVKAFVTNADWSVKMKLNTCYTSSSDGDVIKDYFLVKHGCEVDTNTHFISETMHETKFAFQVFERTTRRDKVFLHCHPVYCDTSRSDSLQQCDSQCDAL